MKPHLVIIGAGLSGLSCALFLQDRFDITILEARERIGGRIASLGGHDLGPTWIWPHHTDILILLRALEIPTYPQYESGHALYQTPTQIESFRPQRDMRYRIEGSVGRLIQTLHDKLHVTTKLSTPVTAIKSEGEKIQIETDKQAYVAEYVISTLPPRLTLRDIAFDPPLLPEIITRFEQTSTWMGHSAKCIITYDKAFWREMGLSGFVFSHTGPLAEIHDACTSQSAALFGFCNRVDLPTFHSDVKRQLTALFGKQASEIRHIHALDWKSERYTSTLADARPTSSHDDYGMDFDIYDGRLFFAGTETSYSQGGYLEGALRSAMRVAAKLTQKY